MGRLSLKRQNSGQAGTRRWLRRKITLKPIRQTLLSASRQIGTELIPLLGAASGLGCTEA